MFGAAKPIRYMDEVPLLLTEDQVVALLSGSGRLAEAELLENSFTPNRLIGATSGSGEYLSVMDGLKIAALKI